MFTTLMNIDVSFAIILLGAAALCYGGELIEPTRTLQDAKEIDVKEAFFKSRKEQT
jgi:hypothetical protein